MERFPNFRVQVLNSRITSVQKRITQIFIGHSVHSTWRDRLFGDPVLRLMRAADGIDVRVFPH